MTQLLTATPESVVLVSIIKPLLMVLTFGAWAYVVSIFDKDLKRWFLPREAWNIGQLVAGLLGFMAILLVPVFWIGWPVAILVCTGSILGYIHYRNNHEKVPEEKAWRLKDIGEMLQARADSKQEEANVTAPIRLSSKAKGAIPVPAPEHPFSNAHNLLAGLMTFALPRRAHQINLVSTAQQTAAEVVIDGVAYPQQPIDAALGVALVDYLKTAADLDVSDRRRKQEANLKVESNDFGTHSLSITTTGSTRGLMTQLAIDPDRTKGMRVDALGLLPIQQQQLAKALAQPNKVVLAAAPPRNGLTTTIYALVSTHDPYTQNVQTVEEKIESEIEGVRHEKIDPEMDDAAYNQRIKALLMREVAVMYVGKIANQQTVQVIADSADEVRFYIGLRQEDTFAALKAWVAAVGDPRTAANALGAVVAQRLVRKLCTTCRVPYQPSADALRKINLPPDKVKQLYKHSGKVQVKDQIEPCPACHGLGFQGMTPVFEVMPIDDAARKLIAAGEHDQLRSQLRRQGMLWLQEAALARAVEGVTSINEITRAMSSKQQSAG